MNLKTIFKFILLLIYLRLPPLIPFEVNLKANTLLQKATHLADKNLAGPETIVFTDNGTMITGLVNGQIVSVDENGNVYKIVQIGDETDEKICGLSIFLRSNFKLFFKICFQIN